MPSQQPPAHRLALRDARERAIALLSDAFAHDVIGLEDFERRLTFVHRADSLAEVDNTLSDLSPAASPLAVSAPSASVVRSSAAHASLALSAGQSGHEVVAIFGGVQRSGRWTVPQHMQVAAICGGVLLDLREATFSPGVTEIHVNAVMGGAQIVVPPTLSVQVNGNAILGGFDHLDRVPAELDPDRPVLRVHGFAIMGGVSVETRLPGESEMDAHRRRFGTRGLPGHGARRLPEKT